MDELLQLQKGLAFIGPALSVCVQSMSTDGYDLRVGRIGISVIGHEIVLDEIAGEGSCLGLVPAAWLTVQIKMEEVGTVLFGAILHGVYNRVAHILTPHDMGSNGI